jgi:hypothetical protein
MNFSDAIVIGHREQRVGTADPLAPRPCVLPLDEPASIVDVLVQTHLVELLARLRRVRSPPWSATLDTTRFVRCAAGYGFAGPGYHRYSGVG